jgi:hypothetical protein
LQFEHENGASKNRFPGRLRSRCLQYLHDDRHRRRSSIAILAAYSGVKAVDEDSAAKKGDYVELYAEIDTMCAISACPGGCNGPVNHGLMVEVFNQPQRHDWEIVR